MALGRAVTRLLIEEAARLGFSGHILQLGPQVVHLEVGELLVYAEECGLDLPPALRLRPRRDAVTADELFHALGFDGVDSCDLFDPSATHRVDLNEPLPDAMRGRYDAVLDGGTMEHVFDTRQVLANIDEALAIGGRAIHLSPVNNWVDHGFYTFSPLLFTRFYDVNAWDLEASWLLHHSRRWQRGRWKVAPYESGAIDSRSMGAWESGMLLVLAIARKTEQSTHDRIPTQSASSDDPASPTTIHRVLRTVGAEFNARMPTDVLRIVPRRFPRPSRRL